MFVDETCLSVVSCMFARNSNDGISHSRTHDRTQSHKRNRLQFCQTKGHHGIIAFFYRCISRALQRGLVGVTEYGGKTRNTAKQFYRIQVEMSHKQLRLYTHAFDTILILCFKVFQTYSTMPRQKQFTTCLFAFSTV